jgi:hypothetical protein
MNCVGDDENCENGGRSGGGGDGGGNSGGDNCSNDDDGTWHLGILQEVKKTTTKPERVPICALAISMTISTEKQTLSPLPL